MSKQKENEFRIETEIAQNLAKYWYEKAELKSYTSENSTVVNLSDLASILDQIPARPHLMPVDVSFEEVCEEDARVQELEAIINKKPEMFDFYQLYKKVEELKREVSHLEGVSDGYAVVEMEDKAKIRKLEAEIESYKKIKNVTLRAENIDLKAEIERLKEYNTRLLDENIKLSNELNLPTDPVERAKVLGIINVDYEAKEGE